MDVNGLHLYGCFLDHTLCTSCGFAALVIASWKGWLWIGDAGSDEMIIWCLYDAPWHPCCCRSAFAQNDGAKLHRVSDSLPLRSCYRSNSSLQFSNEMSVFWISFTFQNSPSKIFQTSCRCIQRPEDVSWKQVGKPAGTDLNDFRALLQSVGFCKEA